MTAALRRTLVVATLWNAQCVDPSHTSPTASSSSSGRHDAAEAAAIPSATAPEVRLDDFKASCLKKFDRIGMTTPFRLYSGIPTKIQMTLVRRELDDYEIESGFASIDAPEGKARVQLRGRIEFSLSHAEGRIFGDVRSARIDVLLGKTKISEKGLWPGYDGQCPVEVTRGQNDYRGFISLVLPMEMGEVECPTAFALPCRLSLDRNRMVLGDDDAHDPDDLYIRFQPANRVAIVLASDLTVGSTNELRIVSGPPHARYVLYGSDRLAEKSAEFEGCSDWDLDPSRQVVVASGSLDSEGEATVRIELPDDAALVGTFRDYQALIETADAKVATSPAVLKVLKK